MGDGEGLNVGLGVGDGDGNGVGDGVGRATHALCPSSPAVHSEAAHGVQLVLASLPANEFCRHFVHPVTLLSPSERYTLCTSLYWPFAHATQAFGCDPRLQKDPM